MRFETESTLRSGGEVSFLFARTLQSWATTDNRVVILDANPLLSGPEGQPSGIFFLPDGVNLNDLGYLRLALLLRQQVEDDSPTLPRNNTTP